MGLLCEWGTETFRTGVPHIKSLSSAKALLMEKGFQANAVQCKRTSMKSPVRLMKYTVSRIDRNCIKLATDITHLLLQYNHGWGTCSRENPLQGRSLLMSKMADRVQMSLCQREVAVRKEVFDEAKPFRLFTVYCISSPFYENYKKSFQLANVIMCGDRLWAWKLSFLWTYLMQVLYHFKFTFGHRLSFKHTWALRIGMDRCRSCPEAEDPHKTCLSS